MRNTVFGRNLYAIGGNREASRLAGMRVDLITTAVYTDLRNDDSQKDWLVTAAGGAFQNTLPGM